MRISRLADVLTLAFVFSMFTQAVLAQIDGLATEGSQASDPAELTTEGRTKSGGNGVALSLFWLAKHQTVDGSWRFDPPDGTEKGYANPGTWKSDSGATALALLPFLGTGQTHKTAGPYRSNITAALLWLLRRQRSDGDLSGDGMPKVLSHGLAAIAFCETYGMTGDQNVGKAAQEGINFIVASQDKKSGGWAEPSGQPTMSVSAWQIMALASGKAAGLDVPGSTLEKAAKFLDGLQAEGGVKYGETGAKDASDAAKIMGLLARMYLGAKEGGYGVLGGRNLPPVFDAQPHKQDAGPKGVIKWLSQRGPSDKDAACNFWATTLIFNSVFVFNDYGMEWDAWNRKMRKQLISVQVKQGDEAGSWWNPNDIHAATGGRLFQTAINAMTMEVYYRYLPLYKPSPEDK